MRQQSLYIPSTEQMERATQRIKHNKGTAERSGGGIGKRREKTTFGRALVRVVHCVDGLKVEN